MQRAAILHLTDIIVVPDAVTGLAIASASESAISLSWRYQSDGSRPRTGVEIEVMTGGTLVRSVTKGPTQTIGNITSLQPLTNYTFIAYVVSEVGRSPPIALQTFTPSLSTSMSHQATDTDNQCLPFYRSPPTQHSHICTNVLHFAALPSVAGV